MSRKSEILKNISEKLPKLEVNIEDVNLDSIIIHKSCTWFEKY